MKIARRVLIGAVALLVGAVAVVLGGFAVGAAIYDRAEQATYEPVDPINPSTNH